MKSITSSPYRPSYQPPFLSLAPMDGVIDSNMRHILTQIGGMDFCWSEFLRISDKVPSEREFFKIIPELRDQRNDQPNDQRNDLQEGQSLDVSLRPSQGQSLTASGIPVGLQLMGHDPVALAGTAKRAVELGVVAIDLNFGCPAKTVNRHHAGAWLLQYPEKIYEICSSVRQSVEADIPVSAKIRLGYENTDLFMDTISAVERAGCQHLTIHARTKVQGYSLTADWAMLALAQHNTCLPIIANGDIVDLPSFERCKDVSGCKHFMIGRGAIANPWIFCEIKKAYADESKPTPTPITTPILLPNPTSMRLPPSLPSYSAEGLFKLLLQHLDLNAQTVSEEFAVARCKQWLGLLSRSSHSYDNEKWRFLFDRLKVEQEFAKALRALS